MSMRRKMRRAMPALLLCSAAALGGCSSHSSAEKSEALRERRVNRMVLANDQRVLGEDVDVNRSLAHRSLSVFSRAWQFVVQEYNYLVGETPLLQAERMEDKNSPDNRRVGIFALADEEYGRHGAYPARYAEIAYGYGKIPADPDYSVRTAAIRVLNRSRARTYAVPQPGNKQKVVDLIPLYNGGLDDKNELVRLESAKALSNIPDPRSIAPLLSHLENVEEAKDVRIAEADALRNFRRADVAQALVRLLQDRDFAVSYQSRKSLVMMTGQDFEYEPAAWLKYLAEHNKPFLA